MVPSEVNALRAHEEQAWTGVELLVCAVLQLILVFLAYRLDRSTAQHWFIPESACAIFFGLCGFFSNFSTILLLAIVGTLVATFVTGGALIWLGHLGWITPLTPAEAYLYGSLISAVDPVATLSVFKKSDAPPMLFNLVFGESVLNDGVGRMKDLFQHTLYPVVAYSLVLMPGIVAIVVFTLFQESIRQGVHEINSHAASNVILQVIVILFGSILLAAVVCLLSAFLLKHADPALQLYPTYEISIILLSAYISHESAAALKHLLSTLAFLAENFIFLYLGVSVVAYSGAFTWDWAFIGWQLLVLLVARAANTFPLCILANLGRKEQIPVFGMLTGPLLTSLGLAKATTMSLRPEAVKLLDEMEDDEDEDPRRTAAGGHQGSTHGGGMQGLWTTVDEKYLMPIFGQRGDDGQGAAGGSRR
ncbi:hypothetical protein DYB36_009291 [Aphanomyces astaci]|uniref:Cation/H+ exchanger transmembrane domain-containing protein n=1 Tax=Aphanomyces astaci TaxID=112090 RepID=A0A397BCT6_APHAT|nr:hypothetical protein DYB36_009291 [Aphanomyces astaci]